MPQEDNGIISLNYLVIVQPGGLPLYAQSFEFDSDEACMTFGYRLGEVGEPDNLDTKRKLLGGYFDAIKHLVQEVVADNLRVIDLGFTTFHISGLIREGINFIGIFEVSNRTEEQPSTEATKLVNEFLSEIALRFLGIYEKELLLKVPVIHTDFLDFTDDIISVMGHQVRPQFCRNCLTKCADHHMGCIPHLLYFDDIVTDKTSNMIVRAH